MISLLNGASKLVQNVKEIEGDKNEFRLLNLDGILKDTNHWRCNLMISLSSMKEHVALTIASLDDYCAVIETPDGFRILCEPPHIPTPSIIEALEGVGWSEIKISKSLQNSIIRIDVLQPQ
jgi:hypothetical protein